LIANSDGAADARRLLIVRLGAMGDVIHTLPAVQALRDAFPRATIDWLIEERWAELLCAPGAPRRGVPSAQRPLVDWVHTVDLKKWGKSLLSLSTLQQAARVWNDVRSMRYDVAIDLQGAIRSALLARWSHAPMIYGATEPRESPASLWYTREVVCTGAHVIDQNICLAEAVAQRKLTPPTAVLPHASEAERRIGQRLTQAAINRYAILNPGAGWGAKRWPPERYGQVAAALADCGLRSIVNHGPGEEDLARAVQAASEGTATILHTTISELIALTRRAALFVGGDTGPLHLAAALQVPVVGIFGPTNPARNGPYETRSVVLRNPASPTTHARNPRPDETMLEISVQAVVSSAQHLLASSAAEDTCG